jgi:hypothetical protein
MARNSTFLNAAAIVETITRRSSAIVETIARPVLV